MATKQNQFKQTIQKTFKEFLNSFKNKKILWIFCYDICLLLIALILVKGASKIMASQLERLGLTNVQTLTPEIISQQLGAIKTLAITFFIIITIFYLINIFNYSLFRTWVWTKIMNKQPTKTFVKKFFLLNLIWITGWMALFILGVTALSKEYYVYMIGIILILYIHLTTIMHHSFTWKQEIKRSIGKAFTLGLGNIGRFIIPYIYIIIIYIILTKVFVVIPLQAQYVSMFVLILLFLAWYRIYINSVIIRIQKRR